jgi:hypothetical protein
MSEADIGGRGCGAIRGDNRDLEALGATDWICLAASPAFAIMALLAGIPGGGSPDVLCSAAHASPLGGMVPMYLLMSAFHSVPWLKLISGRIGRGSNTAFASDAPIGPRSGHYDFSPTRVPFPRRR